MSLFTALRERVTTNTAVARGTTVPRRTQDDERSYREEMTRVRAQQQEIANQKAMEAAAKRREKDAEERQRKNKVAQRDDTNKGEGLVLGATAAAGYNPMQPWSATSRGYR